MSSGGRGEDAGTRHQRHSDAVRARACEPSADTWCRVAVQRGSAGVPTPAGIVHVRRVRMEQAFGELGLEDDDDTGGICGGLVDSIRGERMRDTV